MFFGLIGHQRLPRNLAWLNRAKPSQSLEQTAHYFIDLVTEAQYKARLLLRSSASANDSDAKGVTALHIAVFDGNAELCKVLLNSKADVDAADRHRQTPLFFAPSKEICRLLVERRAEVQWTQWTHQMVLAQKPCEAGVLNRKGQSALHLAGRAGFHDVLSWLSSRVGKPIVELRDHHGNTAQMYVQQALAASLAQAPHGEDQATFSRTDRD
eukprot:g14047.t1